MSFRPLFGVSLFLRMVKFKEYTFYVHIRQSIRGISISTHGERLHSTFWVHGRFRPLFGVSLFLRYTPEFRQYVSFVFVPSTGYLYFYRQNYGICWEQEAFRPLYGVSLFLQLRK